MENDHGPIKIFADDPSSGFRNPLLFVQGSEWVGYVGEAVAEKRMIKGV